MGTNHLSEKANLELSKVLVTQNYSHFRIIQNTEVSFPLSTSLISFIQKNFLMLSDLILT